MSTGVYYLLYFGWSSLEIMENWMQYIGYVDANSYCSFIWNCWGVSQGSFNGPFSFLGFRSSNVCCCCSVLEKRRKNDGKSRCRHSEIGFAGVFMWGWTVFACTNNQLWRKSLQVRWEISNRWHRLNWVWTFHTCRLWAKCCVTEGCCEKLSSLGYDLDGLELCVWVMLLRSLSLLPIIVLFSESFIFEIIR